MPRTFTTREIVLLCGFAGGLAAIDGLSRSSGCVQCEVDLVERSLQQRAADSPEAEPTSPERATAALSR